MPHARPTRPVTVTVWVYDASPDGAAVARLVDEFNRSQTGVRVVIDAPTAAPGIEFDAQLENRFFAAVQSHGPLPDIIELRSFTSPNRGSAFRGEVDSGGLVPAQVCIDAFHTDLSGIVPAALAETRIGTTQWGMPKFFAFSLEGYNTQAFQAAGLDPTRPPSDLRSLVADAEVLRAHGFTTPLADLPLIEMLDLSGSRFTDHDNGESGTPTHAALSSATTTQVLGAAKELLAGGLVAPPIQTQADTGPIPDPTLTLIAEGKAAFAEVRSAGTLDAVIQGLAGGQAPNFTLGFAPLPSVDGPGGISTEAHDWLLTAGSTPERRSAAWEFLTWWNQPAQQAQWAAMTGGFPDQEAAIAEPALAGLWAGSPYLRQAWDLALRSPYVVDDPIGPLAGVETETMNRVADELRTGTSVSAAITDATTLIDDQLDSYNARPADWARCYGVNGPCP